MTAASNAASLEAKTEECAAKSTELGAAQAELARGWHHDTRQWVLARFDTDRSGAIDRAEELGAIPCDYWKGIERSYDTSRLGIPLARIYGFDGEGWKPGSLGVDSEIRDLAFRRLRDCGLRY